MVHQHISTCLGGDGTPLVSLHVNLEAPRTFEYRILRAGPVPPLLSLLDAPFLVGFQLAFEVPLLVDMKF